MGNSSLSKKNIYMYIVSILVIVEFQVLDDEALNLF